MNPNDRFAIIPAPSRPSAFQRTYDWRAAVESYGVHPRHPCAARQHPLAPSRTARCSGDHASAESDTGTPDRSVCDSVNQISARLDALEKRRARKLRQIAAQKDAAEQKQIHDYLDSLPIPNAPASHRHFNTGDLSPLPPTNSSDDNEGDLTRKLSRATPPSPGSYPLDDPSELNGPPQPKYRNPVAVSLNAEDEYDY